MKCAFLLYAYGICIYTVSLLFRIRQLSNSYFEMVTKARDIIIAAHSEIRKNGEDGELNQEQPTPPAFNLEHALEALANNNININNGGCASGSGKI